MQPEIEIINEDPECELVPNYIKAFCATTIKVVNKAEREIAHLITTASTDRVGDVVDPMGGEMANFLRHPVVMADHGDGGHYTLAKIIGSAKALTIEAGGIFVRTKYRDTPIAKDAFNLAAEGLGAWSIGFRPIKFAAMKDEKGYTKGFHFTKWELLEYSQVAIPMNPDIVQNALSKGWLQPENIKTFFRVEDSAEPTIVAPVRANAEPVIEAKRQPISRLTDSQLRRLASIDPIITGCRVRELTRDLGA